MAFIKLIFALILWPITLLDKLFKHKDNLLEWHLSYEKYIVQIKTKYKGNSLSDGLLIASYILFLARYFRICDDRQVVVMKDFLNKEIGNSASEVVALIRKINYLIKQTLNDRERDTVDQFFSRGELPYAFFEDGSVSESLSRYLFLVFEQDGKLTSRFHMSVGWDIVFLPLTVGVLYGHVISKLKDSSKKEILDKAILDLLRTYETVNCRSLAGLYKVPVEVINQNNIDYSK